MTHMSAPWLGYKLDDSSSIPGTVWNSPQAQPDRLSSNPTPYPMGYFLEGKTAWVWSWPLTINYGPILKNALITLRSPYKFAWHRVSSNTRATSYLLSINTDRHDTPIIRPFSALTLTDPELSHQLFSVHIIVVTQDPYDSPRWPELTPRTLHVGFASARVALGQLVFGVLGLSAVNSFALLHDTHSFICNRR
jgi:hypothetical protein